jgi:hypothetical protein
VLVLKHDQLLFAGEECKAPGYMVRTKPRSTVLGDYPGLPADDVAKLRLPARVTTIETSCWGGIFVVDPSTLVFEHEGWFFEAKRVKRGEAR